MSTENLYPHINKNIFISSMLTLYGPIVFVNFYECCWYELDAIFYEYANYVNNQR